MLIDIGNCIQKINKLIVKICLEVIKNEYCEWILMKQKYNFDFILKWYLFLFWYIFYYLENFIINKFNIYF